jgi:hypothetical protein
MNESTRKPYITVFTPTYNRAYTLRRLYESLRKQTQYDFEWLIVGVNTVIYGFRVDSFMISSYFSLYLYDD